MKQYVILSTPIKDTLTMSNLPEILRIKCNIPKNIIEPYYFKKYVINKQFYMDSILILRQRNYIG